MIGTCYLFPIFRPNVLFHLLLYTIFLYLFFGIRGFSDAVLLTSPVIRYLCMITCPVEWRYSNLAIKSNRVILNVCLMSGRLLNRRGGPHHVGDLLSHILIQQKYYSFQKSIISGNSMIQTIAT
jgi:hypothetical protein